jgi:PAS domain S-box-containing protein
MEEITLMNSDATGGKRQGRNHYSLLVVAVIIILIGGIALTIWTAQNESNSLRQQMLVKNRLVKEAFSINQIEQLTGSEADLSSPNYIAMKEDLIRIRAVDPQIRFVYFMGQRPDGKIVFLVDSELPESVDYSPPGQEYPEASETLLNVFVSKGEITEGPSSDRWGTWVSGLNPIIDPVTGNVIAVLGMDVNASDWNMYIFYSSLPIIIGTLILLFIVLVFSYMQQRNEREKQILKESESILRESEHRLNDIINFLPDATFVIDNEGRVITWNKAMEEMTGVKADDILGKGNYEYAIPFYQTRRPILIDLVLKPDSEIEKNYTGGINRQGSMLITETELRRPDGTIIFLAARALPISEKDSTVIGAIESIRDITERKITEMALENYSRELTSHTEILQKTNDKLNLMNSITRHDILNQLTLILGYLELMKEQYPDPQLQKYIGADLRAAQTIQKQIMFTKEYQDIGSQSPKWFNLKSVILSAAAGLSLSPIQVSVDCDQFEVYADPLLEKVFFTLLENAIRHGKKVTDIVFSCREQENGLMVIYEDNGEGIPAAHKKDIFYQKYFQHTGYGLFLTQTILNITGISIRENGEPGKGARFEILVPKEAYRVSGTN